MTFAEQRQKAIASGPQSTRFFAETMVLTPLGGGDAQTVIGKVAHEQLGPTSGQRGVNSPRTSTIDELERIEVYFNLNPEAEGYLAAKPNPGDALERTQRWEADEAKGKVPDRRPYAFSGEVLHEGDEDAKYVYQRRRRVTQGRP